MTKDIDRERPDRHEPAVSEIRENRFAVLLGALVLMMVCSPIIRAFSSDMGTTLASIVGTFLFSFVLLSAVFAVSRSRKQQLVALILAAPAVIAHCASVWKPAGGVAVVAHVLGMLFLTYVIILVVQFLFVGTRVTPNVICASLCVYLLLGIAWAIGYSLIALLDPAAFAFSFAESGELELLRFGGERTFVAIYYSLVTMSTLGYGDIVPISSAARASAAMQAVVGPLYLTVLVARLVGLQVSQANEKQQEARK